METGVSQYVHFCLEVLVVLAHLVQLIGDLSELFYVVVAFGCLVTELGGETMLNALGVVLVVLHERLGEETIGHVQEGGVVHAPFIGGLDLYFQLFVPLLEYVHLFGQLAILHPDIIHL